ncbi:unnamed protein product, partial [Symbiodinium sp. CCMP2456]
MARLTCSPVTSLPVSGTEKQRTLLSEFSRKEQHFNEEYQKNKPLCFSAKSYQRTHPKKLSLGHKDADATLASPMILGVADGVSQLEEFGMDASQLPRELLRICEDLGMNQLIPDRQVNPQEAYQGPVSLLKEAYEETESMGSTTILLAVLDNSTKIHGKLHPMVAVLTIGDCELLMLRRLDGRQSPLQAVFHTEMQRIDGHSQTPLQLARVDDRVDPDFDEELALEVIERGSAVHCVSAYEGDIIILGSDGIFDNLFLEEIVDIVNESLPAPKAGSFVATQPSLLSLLAKRLVDEAHSKSEVGRHGLPDTPIGLGGKMDDTSVVVGEVVEWTRAHSEVWAQIVDRRSLLEISHFRFPLSTLRPVIMSFTPVADVDEVLASSMETVESLVPPRDTGDSDQEWERVDAEVMVARATLAHNLAAHEDEVANNTLASFTSLDVDDTPLDKKLQEMDAALARLMSKGDEKVEVKEEAPPTGDFVPEVGPSAHDKSTAMDMDPADALLQDEKHNMQGCMEWSMMRTMPSGTLEETEEIAALFSKLKTETWTRPAVERVLEVYQIYKRQIAQEKMLVAPFNNSRAGVGHGSLGQLNPGSTGAKLMCPICFSDCLRPDNKVEGKCKLCQKNVIAVDKGPPSAELKLGTSSWVMFCGPEGVTWHTDADEAQKEAASVDIGSWAQPPPRPTDQTELSFADQDWQPSQETRAFHAQLAAAMEIQKNKRAGPVDRRPSKDTEEFFAAQTSWEEAKASNKRMQEEGEIRARLLKPVVESIDTWGPMLRAALEMNVFNPDTPLKDMELDHIEAWTGAFGPEEQTPEAVLGVPVGSIEYQILRLKRIIELRLGEQRMIGGKWKKVQGPLVAPTWAKPLPEAEQLTLEMRTHPCTFRSAFFEPIALTMQEIEAQIAMSNRPVLKNIVGPFHAKDDDDTFHWQKEVQTWDLVSLFSSFGHSHTARHVYAVWSHLPITIRALLRGAKNKESNNQRRDDYRAIQKEAKEFVILHDLPAPTTDLEWKQLYREMGSFFAAKVFVLDLPVSDIHDSKFPDIYNTLSTSLGQEGLNLGEKDTSAAFGAERIILDPLAAEQELSLPPITPDNVSSVASEDYKRKIAKDKAAHVFWARMDCGLVLSSVSTSKIVDKKKGETRGGYVCRHCRGFWRGNTGSSRFLLITGEHKGKSAQLQPILDESRKPSTRFSKTNLLGNVSDLIW